MEYKYGIGPMSKNVVDSCIKYSNENNVNIILIPSRRQVDYLGGYVNGWTTETFSSYVKKQTDKILLKRDHGGPNQGLFNDDGLISLKHDCMYLDAIHIDPWKSVNSYKDGYFFTKNLIQYCHNNNNKIIYEIGTEESIFKYEAQQLLDLINYLNKHLTHNQFKQIKFSVIQCGTSLKESINTGSYNKNRLLDMLTVCKQFNLISKEHNGDYLPIQLIFEKFKCGLNSINIAPEFGQIETKTYLEEINNNSNLFNIFFDICKRSKKWEKWVDKSFIPENNKLKLINICGHYVLNYPEFIDKIKKNIRLDIDQHIQYNISLKLRELYSYV